MQAMGAGGSGSSRGSPTAFLPPNQGAAADAWGQLIQPLVGVAANAGAGTPAASTYPQAQALYPGAYNAGAQYLFGDILGGQPTLYDQGVGQAYGTATQAADLYSQLMPGLYNATSGLTSGASSGLDYLSQVLGNAFNPLYGQTVDAVANNPFYAGAQQGAQQGAGLGGAGAGALQNMGLGLMQSGFDPQSALYRRGEQQALDRSAASNAMFGLGASPYGAGVTNKALNDFAIDWQNQQLNRQTAAAGAASPLLQAAPQLATSSAAAPTSTYLGQLDALIKALNAENAAGGQGASAYGSLLGSSGTGLNQAGTLSQGLAQNTATFGGLPYSTGATIGNNAISGLSNLQSLLTGQTQLGNQQYTLPMEVLNKLAQYMGLGQSASALNGQLGQQAFNQQSSGIGGLLSGANMLLGANSLLGGSSGIFGSGGLLGSLGAAAPMAASSDRRLKRDIRRIGSLRNGLPVYAFRYLWSPTLHVGLMADEVERIHPEAVTEGLGGFKVVNYALAVG